MRTVLLIAMLAFTSVLQAQLPEVPNIKSLKGSFFVGVDDSATIFVNGRKFYQCGIGTHRSPQTELKLDDRIVVHVHTKKGPASFVLVFASEDEKLVVSFRYQDFKIVPGLGVQDFSPEQFAQWNKFARFQKQGHHRFSKLPLKNYSDFVWGELKDSILACIITAEMFDERNIRKTPKAADGAKGKPVNPPK